MKISIDTKEDSHDDLKKVIRMLQNLVGESNEIFTNQPDNSESGSTNTPNVFSNIFGDSSPSQDIATPETAQETQKDETEQSTEDLLAELVSEEEIKKMDNADVKDDEEEAKPKSKKYNVEFY